MKYQLIKLAMAKWLRREPLHSEFFNPPQITVEKRLRYDHTLTSPAPDYSGIIFSSEGERVGIAVYALSPLNDCLYLYEIRIDKNFVRRGYGLAVLQYLAQTYRQPIIPVHELESAERFWDAARRYVTDVEVRESISVSDFDMERHRWAFLKPESDRLQEQISARLMRGESWEEAVGRGLDATSTPSE